MISERLRQELRELAKLYPQKRSALLPALYRVQKERGYVNEEAARAVAEALEMDPAEVTGVATFYSLIYTRPQGKYIVYVCRNISCWLCGCGDILEHIQKRLGIGVGETTRDGMFTLKTVECLASCGTAPVVQIDEDYYENLTPAKMDRVLDHLMSMEGRM